MNSSMFRRMMASFVVLFVAIGVAMASTALLGADRGSGAFGDSERIGPNQLTSATVEIDLSGGGALFDDIVLVPGRNLAPGARLVGVIEIRNVGSLPVRANGVIDIASGSALRSATQWRSWTPPTANRECSETPTAAAVLVFAGDETADLFRELSILPDETALRCIEIALPLDASNALQDRSLSWDVQVTATQAPDLIDTAIDTAPGGRG